MRETMRLSCRGSFTTAASRAAICPGAKPKVSLGLRSAGALAAETTGAVERSAVPGTIPLASIPASVADWRSKQASLAASGEMRRHARRGAAHRGGGRVEAQAVDEATQASPMRTHGAAAILPAADNQTHGAKETELRFIELL